MDFFTEYESPLVGTLTIGADDKGIIGVWMTRQRFLDEEVPDGMVCDVSHPTLVAAREWLDRYFAGEHVSPAELPLAPRGTEFRLRIWRILCDIPYGEVVTYGDVAKRIARETGRKKMSAQAVGGAVGHNPIGIIIPCHRVVGANGNLTGYGGGMQRKIDLLELEGLDMSSFHLPPGCTADCYACGKHLPK